MEMMLNESGQLNEDCIFCIDKNMKYVFIKSFTIGNDE